MGAFLFCPFIADMVVPTFYNLPFPLLYTFDVEQEMYLEAEKTDAGWSDFKDFEVVRKEKESAVAPSSLPPICSRQTEAKFHFINLVNT